MSLPYLLLRGERHEDVNSHEDCLIIIDHVLVVSEFMDGGEEAIRVLRGC